GESVPFSEDSRSYELAFVSPGQEPGADQHIVIPATRLTPGTVLRDDRVPVDIRVEEYMANSEPATIGATNRATAGAGLKDVVVSIPEVSGTDVNQRVDVPSAYVTFLKKGTDEVIGTYLVSLWFTMGFNPERMPKQSVTVNGTTFDVALRCARMYKPFEVKLLKFRFDRYVGTEKPKNFSSEVEVHDFERGTTRTVTISMNEPLRYRGEAFFQSGFDNATEKATILQVVRNPGWLIPYLSCFFVGLGMVVHFGMFLIQFVNRIISVSPSKTPAAQVKKLNVTPEPERSTLLTWIIPVVTLLLVILTLAAMAMPRNNSALDLRELARLPVVEGGRVKPLDTVARVNLRIITHREEYISNADEKKHAAIEWLMETMSGSPGSRGPSWKHRIFRIEHDRLLKLMELKPREGLRYSLDEMEPKLKLLYDTANDTRKLPMKDRELYEYKLLELQDHVEAYLSLSNKATPLMMPPSEDGKKWRAIGEYDRDARRMAPAEVLQRLNLKPGDVNNLPPERIAELDNEL
ncbi:MAG: cytochrome c biogenesis protein ResB, partial [Gemmataceae bacterium]